MDTNRIAQCVRVGDVHWIIGLMRISNLEIFGVESNNPMDVPKAPDYQRHRSQMVVRMKSVFIRLVDHLGSRLAALARLSQRCFEHPANIRDQKGKSRIVNWRLFSLLHLSTLYQIL